MNVNELYDQARQAQDAADKAFKRWLSEEVSSHAAAVRLQNKADEAWRQLTSHPEYDSRYHR